MLHTGRVNDTIVAHQNGPAAKKDERLSPSNFFRGDAISLVGAAKKERLISPSQFQCERISSSDLSINQFRMSGQFFSRLRGHSDGRCKNTDSDNESCARHGVIETENDLDHES